VTDRHGSFHNELLDRLDPAAVRLSADLYAAAYHPVDRDGQPALQIWQQPLTLGSPLPTLPLFLRGGLCLPVNLDSSYDRTCREQRVG